MALADDLIEQFGKGIPDLYKTEFEICQRSIRDNIQAINSRGGETYNFDFWDIENEVREQVTRDIIQWLKSECFRITYQATFDQYWVHWGSKLVDKRSWFSKWFCGYRTL
jgi:hypothetical protein